MFTNHSIVTPTLYFYWLIFLMLIGFSAFAQKESAENEFDAKAIFDKYQVTGSFVMYDLNNDVYYRYNAERCGKRFIPASTYKIFNSLVSLETEVMKDENTLIKWDGEERWNPAWNKDMPLKEAFQVSCVPCYQFIARQVGQETMQHYIDKAAYGNQNIGGGIDMFWLTGELRISQDEQIELLKKLYAEQLPFSKHAMQTVKKIMIRQETGDYTLRGKTGWGILEPANYGWFVGYVEKEGNVYFFANNMESNDPPENFGDARITITMAILEKLAVLNPK